MSFPVGCRGISGDMLTSSELFPQKEMSQWWLNHLAEGAISMPDFLVDSLKTGSNLKPKE